MTITTNRHWSGDEMSLAAHLWQTLFVDVYADDAPRFDRHRVFVKIGAKLKRTPFAVETRLHLFGPSFGAGLRGKDGSPHALAELAARKEAETRRSLTQSVFGDPPPGFSALDRRQRA